jgi:gamma-glutamylputrescine oxidase
MTGMEHRQEHTRSYYAATVNERTDYPSLRGSVTADVCIIGAGFTGVASALTLAERGYRVALVEANRVGWGASGRNGGQLIAGVSGERKLAKKYGPSVDDLLWQMRWRGNDIVWERVEQYGIDCDLKPGYLEVASKTRQLKWLEEEYEGLEKRGHPFDYRLLDRQETADATGTDGFVGGLLTRRNGHLHPLNLCVGEARAAHGLGVQIFEQSPVTRIAHGPRPVVHTDEGEVEAEEVILAGNAYHRLESRHLSGLVFPAGSYIIATEPLNDELRARTNPRDVAVCEMNEILDYWRLSADGRLLYGGRCNYSGRDPKSIQAMIAPRMRKLYPHLADLRIDYEWGGKIGITVNRVPVMGRIGGNVYYCLGYSGHGVNATHIMGEVLADAISGTLETFDLWAGMDKVRIPGGQSLGNQMIALGMLWYRTKDLLP